MQLHVHPKQQPRSKLTCYLDSAEADGSKQSGSVQRPPLGGGGLMIPTLPCGLWCHTRLCLWMAMCSSPLISNRWWETSKWWSFTKTSSQNKVKGTQKNTKWSHDLKKKGHTFIMAAGCAVDATWTYFVLFSFSRDFNNFQSLLQHSVVTTLWITREAISHPSRGWTGLSKATV